MQRREQAAVARGTICLLRPYRCSQHSARFTFYGTATRFGLSNSLHKANWERKAKLAQGIASALNIAEIDKGLLEPPKSDDDT